MDVADLYWLAGILEGEGSFLAAGRLTSPSVTVEMTDLDIIERVARLFGTNTTGGKRTPRYKSHWKVPWRTSLRGKKAIALMNELYPIMGTRRQQQITRAIASWTPFDRVVVSCCECKTRLRNEKAPLIAKDLGVRRETIYHAAKRCVHM